MPCIDLTDVSLTLTWMGKMMKRNNWVNKSGKKAFSNLVHDFIRNDWCCNWQWFASCHTLVMCIIISSINPVLYNCMSIIYPQLIYNFCTLLYRYTNVHNTHRIGMQNGSSKGCWCLNIVKAITQLNSKLTIYAGCRASLKMYLFLLSQYFTAVIIIFNQVTKNPSFILGITRN